MFLEHMNLSKLLNLISCHGKPKAIFFLFATFTVFWLNIAFTAVIQVSVVAHGPLVFMFVAYSSLYFSVYGI